MRHVLTRARGALASPAAALVCDIDGTLALDWARSHLRPKSNPHCLSGVAPEAIGRYMAGELVSRDQPVPGAARFLGRLDAMAPPVFVVTARWEPLRAVTERWLATHYPELRYQRLLMRGEVDVRPSVAVKLDLVSEHCRQGVWLDDDPEMLAAAEDRGFVSLKAPDVFEHWREVTAA